MKRTIEDFAFKDKRLPRVVRRRFYIEWYSWWRRVSHKAAVKASHDYISRRRDDY